MTNKFMNRVLTERIVDTRNYRYVYNESANAIERIDIDYADTAMAYCQSNWETVCCF